MIYFLINYGCLKNVRILYGKIYRQARKKISWKILNFLFPADGFMEQFIFFASDSE